MRIGRPFGALVAAAVLGGTTLGCGGDDGDGDGDATPTESVFSLGVGQCVAELDAVGQVAEVPTVPCSEPHAFEVFALFDIEGNEYPGLDEVERLAFDGCLARFEEYVGIPYESSSLEITNLYPLEDAWYEADDREVVCIAFNFDRTPLTGSIQGSAR